MPLAHRRASCSFAWWLGLAAALSPIVVRAEASNEPERRAFRPSPELDLRALEKLVRTRAAGMESAALAVDLAAAEVQKSHLLPNPTLDASWSTIPIGETNPPNLPSPMSQVPSYSVGVSYTFPLGKRGPLQDRAAALERAARAGLDADARALTLALARQLGVLATTEMRLSGLRRMADEGRKQVDLAAARLAANFASELEVERLRVEASRLEQAARAAESDVRAAIVGCAAILGGPCDPFTDADEARRFLVRWIERGAPPSRVEDRPDVRALDAYGDAAKAEARWAKAQVLPDPTVRVGFTRDQFVISGNQQNSLNLSISVPLPLFDHGQAELAAAEARRAHASTERQKTIAAAVARLPLLKQRLEANRSRQRALSDETLPRAEGALRDVTRAAESRLLPLTDVIQARRMVSELLVAEAESLGDTFEASLEIDAELARTNEDGR